MKVLIFTHSADIDGMGGAVFAKLAFNEAKYVLCDTFSLIENVRTYYDNGEIYNYDFVYITDLWLEDEELLERIVNDPKLKNKFYMFDHHKSVLERNLKIYDCTTIKVSDEKDLCCGTSLFYQYLVTNKLIEDKKIYQQFSELTRRYDTWEWKTKYNDDTARHLTLLFEILGADSYIDIMVNKLQKEKEFSFTDIEKDLINNKIKQVEYKVTKYADKIIKRSYKNLNAGIAFIDYEFRNEFAEYLRQINYDIDFVMMIALDYGTISYRSIKDNIDVGLIAQEMGGKGHFAAAASPISNEDKEQIIRILMK